MIYDEIPQGENKKPLLVPTGKYMPAQGREWIVFTIPDGRKCGAYVAPGQAINPKKWAKRHTLRFDNEKELWVV